MKPIFRPMKHRRLYELRGAIQLSNGELRIGRKVVPRLPPKSPRNHSVAGSATFCRRNSIGPWQHSHSFSSNMAIEQISHQ